MKNNSNTLPRRKPSLFRILAWPCSVASLALQAASALSATPCEELKRLSLPNVASITAEDTPAGPFSVSNPATLPQLKGDLPAFCRVTLLVRPQITIEVWLPKETWNKRFRAEGGGGYVGFLSYWAMGDA